LVLLEAFLVDLPVLEVLVGPVVPSLEVDPCLEVPVLVPEAQGDPEAQVHVVHDLVEDHLDHQGAHQGEVP
jgi:hypothetical protein